ncbi:hypothetical protein RM844_29060 [Streptomyces sp. DSM 44915]|uniref:Uncharacterized protein n=1 Tax=Streptomyces chisholmiae TaxID=3075540 RepID=A0ABU2JZD3_9ACTN|nr:hypothetical protein [Streptomyces sp. DSM 44915]MDT0270329.1 hypothetical protein [Streptomyces sp. DSM 44915]
MKAIRRPRATHRTGPWPGSVARAEDLFAGCVRECAGFLSRLTGPATAPGEHRLIVAAGELVRERAAVEPCRDRSFTALLRAGDAAIAAGQVRLARRLADAAVALGSRSSHAWLLRGRALAADGRALEASDAYRRHRALAEPGTPERTPLALAPEPLTVDGLREWLAGRTVCVVGGGEAVAASGLGPRIDGYDLVMRLDSYQPHAPGTGERTDLHAVAHTSGGPGWRRPAEVRLVFGARAEAWAEAVSLRLVPGAQTHLGDRSLSHPVSDPALLGEPRWATDPSTGFSLVRLLDHLDVNPTIDVVGLAVPGQLRPEEHHWLRAHTRRHHGLVSALR